MRFVANKNDLRLTSISLLANLVTAGFFTVIGLLIGPISQQFGIELTSVTKQFSWLTGCYFVGSMVTFFILDYVSTRTMLLIYAGVILLAAVFAVFNTSRTLLPIILGVIGLLSGIAICIAGTIISKIWRHKHQQIALLSQDVAFNIGGVIFPFSAAYILATGMQWGFSYIVAALGLIVVLYLGVKSSFEFEVKPPHGEEEKIKTELNSSVVLAGIFLFLVVVSKYIIIVWLPNYAETYLDATTLQSGELIAKVFGVALIGSVIGTILIAKVNLTLFIATAVLIGFLSSLQFTKMPDIKGLMLMASIFGLSLSVLWNGFVAYGVALLRRPSHKHVSYIIFCGGAGATVTPLVSGIFVESYGVFAVLDVVAALYGIVFLTIVVHGIALKTRG